MNLEDIAKQFQEICTEIAEISKLYAEKLAIEVQEYAEKQGDQRDILGIIKTCPSSYVKYSTSLTPQASSHMFNINANGWTFPENIAFMLQQIEFFPGDTIQIISYALAYINGEFTP